MTPMSPRLQLRILFYRLLFSLGVLTFPALKVAADPIVVDAGPEADPAAFTLVLQAADLASRDRFGAADDKLMRAVYAVRSLGIPNWFEVQTRLNDARVILHRDDLRIDETRVYALNAIAQGSHVMIQDLRRSLYYGREIGAVIRELKIADVLAEGLVLRAAATMLNQAVLLMQRLPPEPVLRRAYSSVRHAVTTLNQGMLSPERRSEQAQRDIASALDDIRRSDLYFTSGLPFLTGP